MDDTNKSMKRIKRILQNTERYKGEMAELLAGDYASIEDLQSAIKSMFKL